MSENDRVRVILVGPTGLDARLRFRPGVELVHTSCAMDAIAELGEPIDSNSPSHAVVILANAQRPDQDAGEYVRALREIQPTVRVLLASANGRDASAFDGTLDPADDEASIEAALGRHAAPTTPEASAPPSSQIAPASPRSPSQVEQTASKHHAESTLVSALLHGQDIAPPAVEILKERLGSLVLFQTDRGDNAVEVRFLDRIFGWLGCAGVDQAELTKEAAWLAGWLRLGEQQSQLREAALTDPLTGAWNRRYFDRFLPVAIERARKVRGSLTVLVFDIDDFKRFNTDFGHPAGDEILIETVRLLRSTIRPTDRVCRIGGDEFCVIFHEPTGPREPGSKPPDNVYQISKRFQAAICAHRFPKLGLDAPGTLSISGGLATYPWDGRDAQELLQHADQLSLQSKSLGKNAVMLGPGAARVCGEL